jgi:hypothetical protein
MCDSDEKSKHVTWNLLLLDVASIEASKKACKISICLQRISLYVSISANLTFKLVVDYNE